MKRLCGTDFASADAGLAFHCDAEKSDAKRSESLISLTRIPAARCRQCPMGGFRQIDGHNEGGRIEIAVWSELVCPQCPHPSPLPEGEGDGCCGEPVISEDQRKLAFLLPVRNGCGTLVLLISADPYDRASLRTLIGSIRVM